MYVDLIFPYKIIMSTLYPTTPFYHQTWQSLCRAPYSPIPIPSLLIPPSNPPFY